MSQSLKVLFPAEIFVDHTLVVIRDSRVRLPGSSLALCDHARQAAALAEGNGDEPEVIVGALVCGVGHALLQSWERHPSVSSVPKLTPTEAAVAHLERHLPESVTGPIAMLPRAERYLATMRGAWSMSPRERACFEQEPWAADAVALAETLDHAGRQPMLAPPLGHYRTLLYRLCTGSEAAASVRPPMIERLHRQIGA